MNITSKDTVKLALGAVIFTLALTFAYVTANYVGDENGSVTYWAVTMIFGAVYVVTGIVLATIYPVSLGFLFSGTWLFGHALIERFDDFLDPVKALCAFAILVVLYLFAFKYLSHDDVQTNVTPSVPPPPTPPVQTIPQA